MEHFCQFWCTTNTWKKHPFRIDELNGCLTYEFNSTTLFSPLLSQSSKLSHFSLSSCHYSRLFWLLTFRNLLFWSNDEGPYTIIVVSSVLKYQNMFTNAFLYMKINKQLLTDLCGNKIWFWYLFGMFKQSDYEWFLIVN